VPPKVRSMHDPRAGIQPDRDWLRDGYPGQFPTPGRNGVPRPIDDKRIGNTVNLAGFTPGAPVATYPTVRLLDVSLQKIAGIAGKPDAQFDSGSWELSIQATVTQKFVAADPAVFCVVPLLAKVRMGVGDANVDVELSPFPSAAIPLPCDHVIVDVTWDSFRPEDYGVLPGFLVTPPMVSVTGMVQRSTGSSDARRVFVAKGDGVGVSLLGRVPAMAKGAMVYSSNSAEVYAAGAVWRYRACDPNEEITTGTAAVVSTYTGAELGTIRANGALADVPGAARWWIYTAPTMGGPVFIDYEVGL
jgi:hypothetical protein